MSYKGKTYGKASKKASNPFDRLMKEQCNRPVASKSAGIVGRWGQTSYTSLRTATGEKRDGENIPRPKKFFKSRTTENDGVVAYSEEGDEKEYVGDDKVYSGGDEKPYKAAGDKDYKVVGDKGCKAGSRVRVPPASEESVQSNTPSPKPIEKPAKKFFTARNKKPKLDVEADALEKKDDVERSAKPSAGDVRPRVGRSSRNQQLEITDSSSRVSRNQQLETTDSSSRLTRPGSRNQQLEIPDSSSRVSRPVGRNQQLEITDSSSRLTSSRNQQLETADSSSRVTRPGSRNKETDHRTKAPLSSRDAPSPVLPVPQERLRTPAVPPERVRTPEGEVQVAEEGWDYETPGNSDCVLSDHPPIKLKLSLSKSPYKSGCDDHYKVVRSREEQAKFEEDQEDTMSSAASESSELSQSGSELLSAVVRDNNDSDAASDLSNGVRGTPKSSYSSGYPDSDNDSTAGASPCVEPRSSPVRKQEPMPTRVARSRDPGTARVSRKSPISAGRGMHELGIGSLVRPPIKKQQPSIMKREEEQKVLESQSIDIVKQLEESQARLPQVEAIILPPPAKPPKKFFTSRNRKEPIVEKLKSEPVTLEFDAEGLGESSLNSPPHKSKDSLKTPLNPLPIPEIASSMKAPMAQPKTTMKAPLARTKTSIKAPVELTKTSMKAPQELTKTSIKSPPELSKPSLKSAPDPAKASVKLATDPVNASLKTKSDQDKSAAHDNPDPIRSALPPPAPRTKRIFTSRNKKAKEVAPEPEVPSKSSLDVPEVDPSKRSPSPPSPAPVKEAVPLKSPPSEPELSINFPARITHIPNRDASKSKPVKRSIFKSKAKDSGPDQPVKKALSMYNQRKGIGGDKEELKKQEIEKALAAKSASDAFEMEFDSEPIVGTSDDMEFEPGVLTRVASYPTTKTGVDEDGELVTSVKCPKSYKEYFTVIKNVKKAHEINDFGEFQEFNDDVDYILDGLASRHKISTRCLATISLASKCMKPGFRMHLRAHGIVTKFFAELKDAPENPSLALCSSTVLFVLSQDRLNMDLDRDSLELMLNLLDTDSHIMDLEGSGLDGKELERNKQKVVDLCSEMKDKGHAASLNLDLISADHLSMETLLSMTSKRAGEWFKEELRDLGGLEHLMRTFSDCIQYLTVKTITVWTETLKDKLKKSDRVLRVLENVSSENEENCAYLIDHKNESNFLDCLFTLFRLLLNEVSLNPSTDASDKESIGVILRDTLLSVLRVYINLAHDYKRNQAHGSLVIGSKGGSSTNGMIAGVVHCLFILQEYMPRQKRFDQLVLCLTLLINLVENCDENRQILMDLPAPQKEDCFKEEPRMLIDDLIKLFLDREELARLSEDKTDNILDGVEDEVVEINPEYEKRKEEKKKKKEKDDGKDSVDETINKLLSKAGHHMEYTLVASYVTIIVGYLIFDCEDYEQRFREILPDNTFVMMVTVLDKFFRFMKMTISGTGSSHRGLKSTEKILKYLIKVDTPPEPEEEKEGETFTDLSLFEVSNDETLLDSQPKDSYVDDYGFDDWGKL